MRGVLRPLLVLFVLLSLAIVERSVFAAPKKHPPARPPRPPASVSAEEPPTPPAAVPATARDEAREAFQRAMLHIENEAWDAAFAELSFSRSRFPTRAATKNAAICLRKLRRHDEALDMFEALLRDFATLPNADRTLAEREIVKLHAFVGQLQIETEAGAAVIVDGRPRGSTPLGPLRVSAGTRLVRVYKEGFAPFETRLDVPAAQITRVRASLTPLASVGRLRVVEQQGMDVNVVIDGVAVGRAPWEGSVAVGSHAVLLRGEGDLGTAPTTAGVRQSDLTILTLAAVPLDTSVRIEPTPVNARVAIDGADLGHGMWEGRLGAGEHRIEIVAEGFLPHSERVALASGDRRAFVVELERDPNSPMWLSAKRPKLVFDIAFGAGLTPALGGKPDDNCDDDVCKRRTLVTWLAVVDAGYQFRAGFALGVQGGYLVFGQDTRGAHNDIPTIPGPGQPIKPDHLGRMDDVIRGHEVLLGVWGGQRLELFGTFPLTFRLGLGVALGSVSDARTGTFHDNQTPPVTYEASLRTTNASFAALYALPEARIGVHLGDHAELSLGIQALITRSISDATWKDERPIPTPVDGFAIYEEKRIVGKTVLFFFPTIGFRWEMNAPGTH